MKALLATVLVACMAPAFAAGAGGNCPAAADAHQADLLGLWTADFEGQGHVATLLLTKHPEDEESFRGTVDRNGARSELAGDIDNGAFTLEESADGTHISATWLGDVVEGSCGKEIRGTWSAEGDEGHPHNFVMRKQP